MTELADRCGKEGLWRCRCGVRLRNSLDIAVHLGRIKSALATIRAVANNLRLCCPEDIYFLCHDLHEEKP